MTKDTIELLRECAAQDHGMARLRDALGVGLESGWQQRCLGKVADMMEAELEEEREESVFFEVERDELKARVAELVEKVYSFEGETYCGGTVVDWYEMAVRLQAQVDEMNETHMKLPVDADGVPIRPGDELVYRGTELFTCRAVSEKSAHTWDAAALAIGHLGSKCRHVKPETVEGLLEEFGAMFEAETDDIMPLVRDYAERIRKAVDNECQ